MTDSEIKLYQTEDGQTKIEVKFDNETVWLSQKQMAQLFAKDSDTIWLHLKKIYQSDELEELSTTEESSVVQQGGKRSVQRKMEVSRSFLLSLLARICNPCLIIIFIFC
jgi:hypothetical protein